MMSIRGVAFTAGDQMEMVAAATTYGVSSAGLIRLRLISGNYLPEFYQDAYPKLLQE